MIRRLAIALLCLATTPLLAQRDSAFVGCLGAPCTIEPIDSAMLARIRDEGLNRSRVLATALGLSDLQPPRLAGSPGYLASARWARDQLKAWGISAAALEPWGRATQSWVLDSFSVEMVAPFYSRLTAFPRAWSPSTRGKLTGPVIVVRLQADSDTVRLKGKLRGKIVLNGTIRPLRNREGPALTRWSTAELDSLAALTDPGEPKSAAEDLVPWMESMQLRRRLAAFLAREGALALVDPSGNDGALGAAGWWEFPGRRWGGVPSFVVGRSEFNRLLRLVEAGKPVRLALSLSGRRVRPDSLGYNVIAEIPGVDPRLKEQVVMLGGHLDSWIAGSGAADNAAGCAVGMEALRILAALGVQPRRTIRLALWDAEETSEDYAGSSGYVRRHFGDPGTGARLPGHALLSAYFNFDNGGGKIRGISLQGNPAARPLFDQLLAPFADLGATHTSIRNVAETDHVSFWALGLPAFQFIQDPLDYESRTHHTALDLGDYLIEDDLKQAAVVLAGIVYQVAMRDQLVPRGTAP